MKICVDIDDVLCDLVSVGIKLYNSKMNKNLTLADITSFHLHECMNDTDADGVIEIFKSNEIYHHLNPIQDSQWGLETLVNQGHHVFLATATPYRSFANKVEWVCEHFHCVTAKDIICIQDKGVLSCDIMVDDKLDNLTRNLCERVVLDYPWNRNRDKDFVYDIHRAYGWKDIVNIINEIERKDKEWENR